VRNDDGQWWPFISVPLDRVMTAIVGANESGKSHLIHAIVCALTGEGIDRRDFCRYSATGATRDEAAQTLRAIDTTLEGSLGDEAVARQLQKLRRDHQLNDAPLEPVGEYANFSARLRGLSVLRRRAYAEIRL